MQNCYFHVKKILVNLFRGREGVEVGVSHTIPLQMIASYFILCTMNKSPCLWCSTLSSHWSLTTDARRLAELSQGKWGFIDINVSLADSRAIMATTRFTSTHCHRCSTVLITPCCGQFNWTNSIRALKCSGLLSSAVPVIEADGRKIKNVAAPCFVYLCWQTLILGNYKAIVNNWNDILC